MVPNSILAPLNGTPGVVSRVSFDTIYNLVSLKVGSYKKARAAESGSVDWAPWYYQIVSHKR